MKATDEQAALQRVLLGRYSVEREIGRGGMGVVYLARDVALDRLVAIKVLPAALAALPDSRERFLREARTAAGLSHPNIVPIHLVEERDNLVYFVMAYVDGECLGDRVRRAGPLKPADAAKLVQEVAWALAYAHGRGVIHRDIKPDNILIDGGSGRAMVTDFGIARVATSGTVSQPGEIVGTLQYMSPEQAAGGAAIDARSDLYSLGVTAFFALTGRLPFESHNPAALVAMHAVEPAPPVLSVRRGIPARLAEAIDRCLAKDPSARFPSGEALAEAIADAQVARREIAPSVRAFLSAAKSVPAEIAGLGVISLWIATAASNLPSGPVIDTIVDSTLWLLGMLGVVVAARLPFAARGVVRAGLDEHDVAEGAASSILARDANVERAQSQVRVLRKLWVRGALLVWSYGPLRVAIDAMATMIRWRLHPGYLLSVLLGGGIGGALVVTAIRPDLVVGAISGGSPAVAKLVRRLWSGPVGRWFFRLAGIGLRKPKALPVPEAAPTEVVLGRAAAQLFDQLSRDAQARLGRVPDVLRRLERAATALRARRDDLIRALAEVGESGGEARRAALSAELEAAKAEAEHRLAAAVTALENLRLDLLRLRSGIGRPDDLTASIEQARAVGEAVDAELEARREVASLTQQDPGT